MGGDYYERPMEESNNKEEFSMNSDKAMSFVGLHRNNDPKRWADQNIKSTRRHPIVFALDISGSMCDWPKVNKLNIKFKEFIDNI